MIVVNARFLTQPITGVQRFAVELSLQLKKKYGSEIRFLTPKNVLHRDIAKTLEAEVVGSFSGHLWEQIELPIHLRKRKSNLLVNLTNTAPIFHFNKITTFCDISPLTNPEWYSKSFSAWYSFLYPRLVSTSKRIITISDFCKAEILEHLEIASQDVEVIYCALPSTFQPSGVNFTKGNYLLCVSSINPRKNFSRVISAFKNISNEDIKLVIVGATNSNFADSSIMQDKNIQLLGRVTDEELEKLYTNATGFVFASLYEGFGIPPLEAQALGCPVLASDIEIHREILGDSVIYCNPLNINDMSSKMNELLRMDTASLISNGLENVTKFSWFKSAQKLCRTIDEFKI